MVSSEGNVVMVYNGEIYNFLEIKSKLPNIEWKSSSDSEVLLEAYCKYGTSIFSKLRGMFAVVFYHIDKNRIVAVRDQFGIKPVYYRNNDNGFFFIFRD